MPPSSSPQQRYRLDIDGMRAIAILCVLGYHALPGIISGGFIGVDIFFVISGFLISNILFDELNNGSFNFARFYARRIKRIFPSLIPVLITAFILGWFVLLPYAYKQMGKDIASGAGFISNLQLWHDTGYFDRAAAAKPLLHLWSLGIEEQFYIFWPLMLCATWKWRINPLSMIVLLMTVSFLLNMQETDRNMAGAFYSPVTRMWELLLGGALSYMSLYRPATLPSRKANLLSLTGFACIGFAVVFYSETSPFPGWRAAVPAIGAYLMILAGGDAWLNRRILSHRWLVWIGLISYPLYLWHWLLLSFTQIIEAAPLSLEMRLMLLTLSVALALLSYYFLEIPIRRNAHTRVKVTILCLLLAVTGIAGFTAYREDGFESRFPPVVQHMVNLQYNTLTDYRLSTCFIDKGQKPSSFGDCSSHEYLPGKPRILLWGDSHAAQLYPGLHKRYAGKNQLTQLTSSDCPPMITIKHSLNVDCQEINDYVIQYIRKNKPDIVILAGIWGNYDWQQLTATIDMLKQSGVKTIKIVGPVPQWRNSLQENLWKFFSQSPLHTVPVRMTFGLIPGIAELDHSMQAFFANQGVDYISAFALLCDTEGCLVRTGDAQDSITAWDFAHLTTAGSIYLVSHFPE